MPKPKALSPQSTPAAGLPAAVAEWTGLLIILALFTWLMYLYFTPAFYGAVDESAYLLEAKTLATTHQPIFHLPAPFAFTSENMLERAPGEFVAKYPPGYPLLCAIGYTIAGTTGALTINPLLALTAIIATHLLLRNFISPLLALAGAITLALHPMTLLYATGTLSHMAETTFTLWGFVALLRWTKTPTPLYAAIATFLLAYGCSIRYTAALAILPMLVLILPQLLIFYRTKKFRQLTLNLLAMTLAALIGLAPLLWYQYAAFGSPFATGYGLTQESNAFSITWFAQHAIYALTTLGRPGYGLVLLFPIALISLVITARKTPKTAAFFAAWIIPPILLYMSYYWFPAESSKANYVRFYYQLYPPIIAAALLLIQQFTQKRDWLDKLAATSLGLIALASFAFGGAYHELDRGLQLFAQEAAISINRNVPKNTPVLCDMHLAYFAIVATDAQIYTSDYFDQDFIKHFPGSMTAGGTQVIDPLRAQRLAAVLGNRSQQDLDAILTNFLAQRAPAGMYLITTQDRAPLWKRRLAPTLDLIPIQQGIYQSALFKIKLHEPHAPPP